VAAALLPFASFLMDRYLCVRKKEEEEGKGKGKIKALVGFKRRKALSLVLCLFTTAVFRIFMVNEKGKGLLIRARVGGWKGN